MRETLRAEASGIHWMEKVGYRIVFAAEDCENDVVEDIAQFIDRMIKQYEKETYRIRLKAYEEGEKGISILYNLILNYDLDKKVCASIMSNNLLCEKSSSGTICNECHFKALIADCDKWVNELNGNIGNRTEQISRLEKAELRFDDAVELIVEKRYKVN